MVDLEDEVWKDVVGYEELFSVSNKGRLFSKRTNKILKQNIVGNGYNACVTKLNGRKGSNLVMKVHREVAKAFIPNKKNLPQVDHINGDKTDNIVSNLRWVTVSQNCFGFGYDGRVENRKKKVRAFNSVLNKEIIFNSRDETAKYFKCHKSQISYGKEYVKGNKKGWIFNLVKDIV